MPTSRPTSRSISSTRSIAHASLIGARGIGELGATGVDAAIAAAVYDAVGVRVREIPITPDKVLAGLSSAVGDR